MHVTLIIAVVAFTVGLLAGATVAVRVTPTLVAMLSDAEQLAFARKVRARRDMRAARSRT